MPKKYYIPRELKTDQPPDRCELCPLLGKIPESDRTKGERKGYYCLGVLEADENEDGVQEITFPKLTSKGIYASASENRRKGHLLHRPCDHLWDAWLTLPGRLFPMLADTYKQYRLPMEHELQIKRYPKFKFRIRNRKKK